MEENETKKFYSIEMRRVWYDDRNCRADDVDKRYMFYGTASEVQAAVDRLTEPLIAAFKVERAKKIAETTEAIKKLEATEAARAKLTEAERKLLNISTENNWFLTKLRNDLVNLEKVDTPSLVRNDGDTYWDFEYVSEMYERFNWSVGQDGTFTVLPADEWTSSATEPLGE